MFFSRLSFRNKFTPNEWTGFQSYRYCLPQRYEYYSHHFGDTLLRWSLLHLAGFTAWLDYFWLFLLRACLPLSNSLRDSLQGGSFQVSTSLFLHLSNYTTCLLTCSFPVQCPNFSKAVFFDAPSVRTSVFSRAEDLVSISWHMISM